MGIKKTILAFVGFDMSYVLVFLLLLGHFTEVQFEEWSLKEKKRLKSIAVLRVLPGEF